MSFWDSGLDWDTNVGPSLGDVSPWMALITPEHAVQPLFTETVGMVLQPLADVINLTASMSSLFDLDVAVGDQLDTLGLWIGRTRFINTPLTGVYFAFDTAGVGFDRGTWFGPFNPLTGVTKLPDDTYRTLLRATIAANHWNGTIPGAYAAFNSLFPASGFTILIQDLPHMHMIYALLGALPDATSLALFTQGLLSLKSAGVMIDSFMTPSVPSTPYFGLDVQNSSISGFDTGAWGTLNPGL
jgi:Protein of unknown function (DUF2612)